MSSQKIRFDTNENEGAKLADNQSLRILLNWLNISLWHVGTLIIQAAQYATVIR